MKKLFCILIIACIFYSVSISVLAEEAVPEVSEKKEIENFFEDYTGIEMKSLISEDGLNFNPKEILNILFDMLAKEVRINYELIIKIFSIGVLMALLKALSTNINFDVAKYADFACNAILVGIILIGINICIEDGFEMIERADSFIKSTLPVFSSMLAMSGAISSGAVISPILLIASQICVLAMRNVFVPLLSLSLAFTAIDSVLDKEILGGISRFFKSLCMWGMGVLFTVFVGIVSLQGLATGVTDGLGGKTAKFAISSLIPFAGGYLADSADTVLGSLAIMRNYTGIGIIIALILIILVPVLKILVISFIYKLAALAISPFVKQKTTELMGGMASSVSLIAGLCASVGGMMIIILTWIINAANNSTMMR